MVPPLGWKIGRPLPISAGNENRSSSAPSLVIALLRLRQHPQVLVLLLARRPGGPVDPLQLRVLLAAAPVGTAAAHELERRYLPGGRQVRAAAQVFPAHLAGAGIDVVVDGQLAAADLHGLLGADRDAAGIVRGGQVRGGHLGAGRLGGGPAALQRDQLELVGLAGQLGPCLVVGHHAALEALALPDDLAHPLLDRLQVVRAERPGHVEVVVETVLHRRPDAQLRLREQLLDRLGQHVRGRVPQDGQPVRAGERHRLDGIPVGQCGAKVTQRAVNPGRQGRLAGRLISGERGSGRRPGFHHELASGEGDVKLVGGHG